MAQRMANLSKWFLLEEGNSIHYVNPRGRPVAIEVNSPGEVCFYVIQDQDDINRNPAVVADKAAGRFQADEDRLGVFRQASKQEGAHLDAVRVPDGRAVTFLALVKGRDRLEFSVDGEFDLMVEGGSANVFSVDSTDIATRIVAPEIYTRVANRRQRNPELEWMMYQQRRNQENMMAQLREETDRRMQELEQGLEKRYARQRDATLPAARTGKPEAKPVERAEGDAPEVAKDGAKKAQGSARAKVRAPATDDGEGED